MDAELKKLVEGLGQSVTSEDPTGETGAFFSKYFHLPGNPFPPSGIADATEENPPLRRDIALSILGFIGRSYISKQLHSMIVSGDYGTGKTHTLRYIENIVNSVMNTGNRAARAIYVERPRIEAHELNRTILRSLGHDTARKYVWFVLRGVLLDEVKHQTEEFLQLRKELATPIVKGKGGGVSRPGGLFVEGEPPMAATFDQAFESQNLNDYRTFLSSLEIKGWNREAIRPYLVRCLLKAIPEESSSELAQAFVALLLARDDTSFASWESLVSISNTKQMSAFRAPTFLQFLLRIMQINGIAYLYLLLDEFEEVPQGFHLTPRQRQEYLYTMREVFDKIQNGLAVVMSITPDAFDTLNAIAPPFADRNPEIVQLPPLETDEAINLVRFYFDRERADAADAKIKKIKAGSLQPLSRELVSYILENFPPNVQHTPRSLIQFLHRLFNHAAQNQITEITSQTIQPLLAEFGEMKPRELKKLSKRR